MKNIFFSTFLFLYTLVSAQTIAGGGVHSLAICYDGTIRAWGDNNAGQLGNGNNTTYYVPVQVVELCTQITSIIDAWAGLSMISVFPNPSSGIFTVNLNGKSIDSKICVYDVLGNCVLTQQINNKTSRINLNGNAKGIYFVEIEYEGKRINKKVIMD